MGKIAPVEQLLDRIFIWHNITKTSSINFGGNAKSGIGSTLNRVQAMDSGSDYVRCWPGAMPGISIISNWALLCHMDMNGHKEWYDLLVTASWDIHWILVSPG